MNDRKRFEDIELLYSTLNEEVDKEFESKLNKSKINLLSKQNISEIHDAEDLFLLKETSYDAETFEVLN